MNIHTNLNGFELVPIQTTSKKKQVCIVLFFHRTTTAWMDSPQLTFFENHGNVSEFEDKRKEWKQYMALALSPVVLIPTCL